MAAGSKGQGGIFKQPPPAVRGGKPEMGSGNSDRPPLSGIEAGRLDVSTPFSGRSPNSAAISTMAALADCRS